MKLILSNNQSKKFKQFHDDLQQGAEVYTYVSYKDILFYFDVGRVTFITIGNGLYAHDYEAAYITSYQNCLESAIAVAIVLDAVHVHYVDSQLRHSISTSKLTEYARLGAHGVSIPKTYAGNVTTLISGINLGYVTLEYPLVLKRATADRGIDNFVIDTQEQLLNKLQSIEDTEIWILQAFVANKGFYRLTFYENELSTIVYRATHVREDGNQEKRHLNKPKGGVNAQLLAPHDIDTQLIDESVKACKVMGREFAGVDALLGVADNRPYILEVNYNPQLVTVQAFKEERANEFIKAMKKL